MNILSAENLGKRVADKDLFSRLPFGLENGEKVGLIGINGSGKTTLLRILAGVDQPDTGQVVVGRGIRRAYLPQQPQADPTHTVLEHLFSGDGPRVAVLRSYEEASARQAEGADNQALLDTLSEELDAHDAWGFEHSIRAMLHRFGITDLQKCMGELSGGMVKKTTLSQVLIDEADILFLDEPTNHLDIETVAWLEEEMRASSAAMVVVTHDRYFLENVVHKIYELESGEIRKYPGNYSAYLTRKAEEEEERARETQKAKGLLRKELEWLSRQPKARGTKSKSRIDRVAEVQKRIHVMKTSSFEFSAQGRPLGKKILSVVGVTAAYGERVLFSDFTHHFRRGERIGVVGSNGVGKTTLLELLVGQQEPTEGKITPGVNTQMALFSQTDSELPADRRILQYVRESVGHTAAVGTENVRIETGLLLEMFRLNPAQLIGRLSGGERRRLQLVTLLAGQPNFLVLDEPSNDLDTSTLSILEDFLLSFPGCLVTASHDRWFMDRIIDLLFVIDGRGQIRKFPGSFSEYLEFKGIEDRAEADEAKRGAVPGKPGETGDPTKTAAGNGDGAVGRGKKLTFKEAREYAGLEGEISQLEARRAELAGLLHSGESDYRKLQDWGSELSSTEELLRSKTERWLMLSDRVE